MLWHLNIKLLGQTYHSTHVHSALKVRSQPLRNLFSLFLFRFTVFIVKRFISRFDECFYRELIEQSDALIDRVVRIFYTFISDSYHDGGLHVY